MTSFLDRDQNLLRLHSEFVGDSQLRVRVRNYGRGSKKILVDVMELTYHRTSMARARKIACAQASMFDISSFGSLIRDNEIDKKVTMWDGTKTVVRVRQTCFAFEVGL
jgi:hypothetical protein